ncbi:MAG: HlyC/CorC family transporter [Spirochaetales bacterium]|nr:HlyC/CorC family transporter [Spirochaetales bacterium]
MDDDPLLLYLILLVILLSLSFFFSGSETSVFSLNRLERNSLLKTRAKKRKAVIKFILDHQEQLLITILTGNMVVNVFASSIGEIIGSRLFGSRGEVFSIAAMTVLLVLAGELTPKRIAVLHSKAFTRMASFPLYYLHAVLSPVRKVLTGFTRVFLGMLPRELGRNTDHKHAVVLSTAELGLQQQILKQSEYRLFKSYITFKEKTAASIMIPRSELKTLSWDMKIGEVLKVIAEDSCYVVNSSVLLYKEDNDHLYGWVSLPALLTCKYGGGSLDQSVGGLAQQFHTVPDSKNLPTLITELRETGSDIVLLVDEYGGTAGVVWFRNIIEDVLKAFYAPYKEQFENNTADDAIVPGSMPMEEFADLYGAVEDTDAETVAGFFLELYDDIPDTGNTVEYRNLILRVTEMDGNKITGLKVEVKGDE